MATGKIAQLEAQIASARRMQAVLRTLTDCGCPTLAACARVARSVEAE